MKYLVIVAVLAVGLSAFAAPEVHGPRDVDITLGELSGLPEGLVVSHTPEAVDPSFAGPVGNAWVHRTTVASSVGPVTIVEHGYFVERDGHWYRAAGSEGALSGNDFAERFDCPGARLEAGAAYTDQWNRSIKENVPEQAARWYFIGVDAEGQRVKGEATVVLRGGTDGC